MGIMQTVISQGVRPEGALGRVVAWGYLAMFALFRSQYEEIARLLDLGAEDEVLDVACGSGAFLDKYAAHTERIAGLDHSDIQIKMARKRHRERIASGTADIRQGDATDLPWKEATFSAVTCNCLGCFAQPLPSLREMYRVLRPGGRAVLAFDYRENEQKAREFDQKYGLNYWNEGEVRQLMVQAGFSEMTVSRSGGTVLARVSKPSLG